MAERDVTAWNLKSPGTGRTKCLHPLLLVPVSLAPQQASSFPRQKLLASFIYMYVFQLHLIITPWIIAILAHFSNSDLLVNYFS